MYTTLMLKKSKNLPVLSMTTKEFKDRLRSGEIDYFGGRKNAGVRGFKRKYGNTKTVWTGNVRGKQVEISFDSIAEKQRGVHLLLLERSREISDLRFQEKFRLLPNSKTERGVSFKVDFCYFSNELNCEVAEDLKSPATKKEKAYVIKRKLFKFMYPKIIFKETVYE